MQQTSILRWMLSTFMACGLVACAPQSPTSAEIESIGIRATQARQADAMRQLESWSKSGYPVAQRELALALANNTKRWPEAIGLLERAAKSGDSEAAYMLGDAHRIGRYGFKPDSTVSLTWFTLAAKHHHADAALALARQWRNGDGTQRDDAEAFKWLKQASKDGNSQAMFLLSQSYAEGRGTTVSLPDARRWLGTAADKHYSAAMQAYALALQNGELGLEKNPKEAAELFAEASEERNNRWDAR